MRPLLIVVVVAVLAVLGLGAGRRWVGADLNRRVAPSASLADQCGEVPNLAERVVLRSDDGVELGGAVVGAPGATTGVVLRHGASQTICHWLPWAADVAAASNVRVLLFDRRGTGSSSGESNLAAEPGDVAVAVAWLRANGVGEVALMGSSLGNAAMFAALPALQPAPCTVISVSTLLPAPGPGGTVDGGELDSLPVNVWLTWETGNAAYADQAQQVIERQAAAGRPAPRQLAVDTTDHSIALVTNHREVRAFLREAIESCGA